MKTSKQPSPAPEPQREMWRPTLDAEDGEPVTKSLQKALEKRHGIIPGLQNRRPK